MSAGAEFLDLKGYDSQSEEAEIVRLIRGLAAGELAERRRVPGESALACASGMVRFLFKVIC